MKTLTITVPISAVVNNGIGTTTIADVDDGDDVGGIAVTSTVGEGQWSYSLDGQNFTDMNGVATANALLLPDNASLRYVPNGLYSESASITYVAWDKTSGQAGQQSDASTRGDHTSFSLDSDTLTIQVTDVNDAPTLITLSSSSVPENTTGDEIGDVTADDPDPGDSHSFTVSDNRFEVVGGKLKLIDSQAVDFESEGTIDVTITAADDGVPVLDYSQGFTITVIDQNDATTVAVPLEDQTAYVTRPFEFEVVETTFADEDAGDHLTYSASMVDGSPLPAWLNFDPTDRTFRGTPSVSDAGSLEIRVTVTDAGTPSMNVYDDLTLVVDDNPFPWQNPILNVDVDDKDGVIPLDALIIINYINLHPGDTSLPDPPAAPPPYYDVNGDNAIAAIDALQVINYLNDQIEGEGESTTSANF